MFKKKPPPSKYSLRGQLLVLGGTTFLLCLAVIVMFFPFLNMTMEGFHQKSVKYIEQAKQAEATTLARLLVLELTRVKDLLQVGAATPPEAEQNIKNLLWETVIFNVMIEGIELIQKEENAEHQHVTFRYYRQQSPQSKAMQGPQKVLKSFSGLEKELIKEINQNQTVDKTLLESVNRGPKEEGEMLLRYFPLHVLKADEGAVYWGVAKIGINTAYTNRILAEVNRTEGQVRQTIWLEIVLSLVLSGILAMSLIYYWVHNLTDPLKKLSAVAVELRNAQPQEFELWLENLERVNPKGQGEVAAIQEIMLRLGHSIPRLGQRLITGERRACLGKMAARSLPALQEWRARLQTLQQQESDSGQPPTASKEEMVELLSRLQTRVQDILRFWAAGEVEWRHFDLAPGLHSAWRLATAGLPGEVQLTLDIQPLPQVWGSPVELPLAVLYLLDATADFLEKGDRLSLTAGPSPAGGAAIAVEASGSRLAVTERHDWLSIWDRYGKVREQMGPALAAAIASQHGGSLTVQSTNHGGIRFSLELPPTTTADESLEPYI